MAITFHFGPFRVRDGESLWFQDSLIPLSPLQLRLLSFLCRHPQEVLDKERIVREVWGRDDVSDVSLARAVHGLRSRLAQGGRANELIRNIYGRGYILTIPVVVSDDTAPSPLQARSVVTKAPSVRVVAEPRPAHELQRITGRPSLDLSPIGA